MVLDKKRDSVDPLLSVIAKRFSKVNPDVLTWIALLFAVLSGIFFYFSSAELELLNYFLMVFDNSDFGIQSQKSPSLHSKSTENNSCFVYINFIYSVKPNNESRK